MNHYAIRVREHWTLHAPDRVAALEPVPGQQQSSDL